RSLLQRVENPVYAKLFLTGMSFWFYGYYNYRYLSILLISIAANYILSFLFHCRDSLVYNRVLLGLGILGNVGVLFYFKYFNFFLDNCNFFLHTDFRLEKITLPLGISFFTFQQISYCVERYQKKATHPSFLDYSCFVSFFPQLIAGPIVLQEEFLPQLHERKNRHINTELFYNGLALFILGLGKKVLLADTLAVLVNAEYGNIAYLDTPSAWLTILCYMLELYFDFSGYCDMARGIGKMFGFELPENFDSPLMSTSVKDFWRRWHKTLSRFLMTYIYIPLGGNRKGKIRQCINLLVVFLVSGIWHGANWTFIIWGCMHGIAVVFETLFPKLRFSKDWMNRIVTGVFVTLSFSVFRADSVGDALLLWKKLFAVQSTGMLYGMCNVLQLPETYVIRKLLEMKAPDLLNVFYAACTMLLLGLSFFFVGGKKAESWIEEKKGSICQSVCLGTVFVWVLLSMSQVSTFLYFNF
ncbi:MAG: MBOAT family O-acyltransferase, partial [Acetatifactor sp.]